MAPSSTCFVVDDDPDLRRILVHSATRVGFASVECESVADLGAALDRTEPDVVFLDAGLRNSDALEALELMAQRGCSAAVMLVSGRSREELKTIEDAGLDRGLDMLPALTKPFASSSIRNALTAVASKAEAPS